MKIFSILLTLILFANCSVKQKSASKQEPIDSINKKAFNPSDSSFITGWYYVTDSLSGIKMLLDKTENEYYYINPVAIVTVKNFKRLELGESNYDKSPFLAIYFDEQGTETWKNATGNSINDELALIVKNKLVTTAIVRNQITVGVSALGRTEYKKEDLEKFEKIILEEMK